MNLILFFYKATTLESYLIYLALIFRNFYWTPIYKSEYSYGLFGYLWNILFEYYKNLFFTSNTLYFLLVFTTSVDNSSWDSQFPFIEFTIRFTITGMRENVIRFHFYRARMRTFFNKNASYSSTTQKFIFVHKSVYFLSRFLLNNSKDDTPFERFSLW